MSVKLSCVFLCAAQRRHRSNGPLLQHLWEVPELGLVAGQTHAGPQWGETLQMLHLWTDLHHQRQHAQVHTHINALYCWSANQSAQRGD